MPCKMSACSQLYLCLACLLGAQFVTSSSHTSCIASHFGNASYHWPSFHHAAAADSNHSAFSEVNGPTLFKKGTAVSKHEKQCLVDKDFASLADGCVRNPSDCPQGFSVSLFYRPAYDRDPEEFIGLNASASPIEYILSNGGAVGQPGFSIYRRGAAIGAIVSTGNMTWEVDAAGYIPEEGEWTRLGVTWEPPTFDTVTQFEDLLRSGVTTLEMGGLHLLVDTEIVAHVLQPTDVWGCEYQEIDGELSCVVGYPDHRPAFEPPQIAAGCYMANQLDADPEHFGGGSFDEIAFWPRVIEGEEVKCMMGEYVAGTKVSSVPELSKLVELIDVRDNSQLSTVLAGLRPAVCPNDLSDDDKFDDRYEFSSSEAEEAEEAHEHENTTVKAVLEPRVLANLTELRGVANKLLFLANMTEWFLEDDFKLRLKIARCLSHLPNPNGALSAEVMSEHSSDDPNCPGWHPTREKLTKFLDYVASRAVKPRGDVFLRETFQLDETLFTDNYGAEVRKLSAVNYRRQGAGSSYFEFPDRRFSKAAKHEWEELFEVWRADKLDPEEELTIVDRMLVPTSLFTGKCETKDVTFVGEIYDTFPDSGRKNPVYVRSSDARLDSRVMSVTVTASSHEEVTNGLTGRSVFVFDRHCDPDWQLLVRYPVRFVFEILSERHGFGQRSSPAARSLMGYFDTLDTSRIRVRHCVRWNTELGTHGAWDTSGVRTISANATLAECSSPHMGAFAILAELEDDPWVLPDASGLWYFKMILYGLSLIGLVVLVAFIFASRTMWDMFHVLILNFGFCLIMYDIFMLAAEMDGVRGDRDACCVVGIMLSLFSVAAAAHLFFECVAIHRAVTGGVVAGWTRIYICFAWGIAFISVGYNIQANLPLMGTDPRCMVGWYDHAKWAFFVPMLALCGCSFLLAFVFLVNITRPQLHQDNLLLDIRSLVFGVSGVVLLYSLQWSLAPFAYIQWSNVEVATRAYPVFQVLSGGMGLAAFGLLGIFSRRFRLRASEKLEQTHHQFSNIVGISSASEDEETVTVSDLNSPVKTQNETVSESDDEDDDSSDSDSEDSDNDDSDEDEGEEDTEESDDSESDDSDEQGDDESESEEGDEENEAAEDDNEEPESEEEPEDDDSEADEEEGDTLPATPDPKEEHQQQVQGSTMDSQVHLMSVPERSTASPSASFYASYVYDMRIQMRW